MDRVYWGVTEVEVRAPGVGVISTEWSCIKLPKVPCSQTNCSGVKGVVLTVGLLGHSSSQTRGKSNRLVTTVTSAKVTVQKRLLYGIQ